MAITFSIVLCQGQIINNQCLVKHDIRFRVNNVWFKFCCCRAWKIKSSLTGLDFIQKKNILSKQDPVRNCFALFSSLCALLIEMIQIDQNSYNFAKRRLH